MPTTQNRGALLDQIAVVMNWDCSALCIVDLKTCCSSKLIKKVHCRHSAEQRTWLLDQLGVQCILMTDLSYPAECRPQEETGWATMDHLLELAEALSSTRPDLEQLKPCDGVFFNSVTSFLNWLISIYIATTNWPISAATFSFGSHS